MIQVRYFARLREILGRDGEELRWSVEIAQVAGLTRHLLARGGVWERELGPGARYRVAVNRQLAGPEAAIRDSDEVAYFPPVTGG